MRFQGKVQKHIERALSIKSFGNRSIPWQDTTISVATFKKIMEAAMHDTNNNALVAFLAFCLEYLLKTLKWNTSNELLKECIQVAMILYGIANDCTSQHYSNRTLEYAKGNNMLETYFEFSNYESSSDYEFSSFIKYRDLLKPFTQMLCDDTTDHGPLHKEVMSEMNVLLDEWREGNSKKLTKYLHMQLLHDIKTIFADCAAKHYEIRHSRITARVEANRQREAARADEETLDELLNI